jgi:non-ribosomal peptide synthetase component F/acyl carrier protein
MDNITELIERLSPEEKRALAAQLLRARIDRSKSLYPLSHGQRALWFLHQLAPESAAYNVNFTGRIRGPLDVAAIKSALQALLDRHAALRTTFVIHEGEPMQKVHEQVSLNCKETDAADWDWAKIKTYLAEEAHKPFNLETAPLMRAELLVRSAQEHIITLTVHHIVGDYWSLMLLVDEVRAVYPAQRDGTRAALAPIGLQYSDYVRWQAKMLRSPEGERLWSYWRRQLGGELPVLQLPTERVRAPVQTYSGKNHFFKIDERLTGRLNALAKSEGVTLYMVMLAAFHVLLHRTSGQDDVFIGSPMFGRSRPEFAQMVGYFTNMVVLRAKFADDPTFSDCLSQARQTVLGALKHQEFPFSLLVERLQPVTERSHPPLFQAAFVLEKSQVRDQRGVMQFLGTRDSGRMDMAGLNIESVELERRAAQVDLTLMMEETGGELLSLFEYNSHLFDAGTVARMAEHFQALLQDIVSNPRRRVSELALVDAGEREYLLTGFNDASRARPTSACVHQLFEAQARRSPAAVAHVFEGDGVTYGELNRRADRRAGRLKGLGVAPEVRVAISAAPSAKLFVGLLAILKAGGACVLLGPSLTREQMSFVLKDARVSVLLTRQALSNAPAECVEHVLSLDTEEEEQPETAVDAESFAAPDMDNLACVVYASAAGGETRGMMLTHRALSNRLLWLRESYSLRQEDRLPSLLYSDSEDWTLKGLLTLTTGAQLVLPSLDRLKSRALDGRAKSKGVISGGSPIAGAPIYILDARLQPSPTDVPGELHVGGSDLPRGYLNRPGLTSEKFIPNPFGSEPGARLFKTGLSARHRGGGRVEMLGSVEREVNVRGYRVRLGDVEEALDEHGAILESHVLSHKDDDGEELLVAYVVTDGVRHPSDDELLGFARLKLPEYMLPSVFVRLEALPLTFDGKIDAGALPPPDGVNAPQGQDEYVAPRDALELQLAQIWEEVLDTRPVGVKSNFFALGGHSLSAMTLLIRIQEEFGRELPLPLLIHGASIESVANMLRGPHAPSRPSSLVPLKPEGTRRPFFCVHPIAGNLIAYTEIAQRLAVEQPFYGLQSRGLSGRSRESKRWRPPIWKRSGLCSPKARTCSAAGLSAAWWPSRWRAGYALRGNRYRFWS